MNAVQQLLTNRIDIWTAAEAEKRSGRGRASGNAASVHGIKKLRELILELAVRGMLVPQDSSDEPASELLKRIQIEKAILIAEGQIKKEKSFDPISSKEIPFQLPHGWKWVRIGQIGHDWGQKIPDCDFTYIEVSAIDNQRGVISSAELVKPEDAPSRARKLVKNGTLIYSTIRPYLLNIAVVEENFLPEPIASTAFAIVHPFCAMPPRYFLFSLRSPAFVHYVESVQMGIAYPAINDRQFFSGMIPLPPIQEQHRIVAKVDELMALCDQLEAQHSDAADAHEQLVSQLLGTLTQSQSAADFSSNWQRIAAHFDTLFTTEVSIDVLKQTLLQLAVMGKLVAQDANDEPASELLLRIEAQKAKLSAKGRIKNAKPLPAITEKEKPYPLPKNWDWVQLGTISEFINGDRGKNYPNKNEYVSKGIPWINTGHIEPDGTLTQLDMNYISREKFHSLNGGKIQLGDLVYCLRGATFGKTAIVDPYDEGAIASSLMIIRPSNLLSKKFMLYYLVSQTGKSQIFRFDNGSAQPNLSANNVKLYVYPMPPVSEQQRIVAKVDDLMALCDRLRARINDANQQQKKLADVLVEHAAKGLNQAMI